MDLNLGNDMVNKLFLKTITLCFILLGSYHNIKAQAVSEGIGGSSYSVFGIGEPTDITSDNFIAQGILGVDGLSNALIPISNPALWNRTFFTQAFTRLEVSKYSLENSGSAQSNTNLAGGYLHLLFPLYPGKLGLSASLYPVTRSNFRVTDSGRFAISSSDSVSFNNEIETSGGINKLEIGFGIKLTDNISLGYAPSLAFMNKNNSESISFSSALFGGQDQVEKSTGVALSQRFGLSLNFSQLFRDADKLAVGATINLPYELQRKTSLNVTKVIDGIEREIDYTSTLNDTEGDVKMPLEATLGVGYAPSILVNFSGEMLYQKWSDFSSSDLSPDLAMKDRFRFGFGGQYHASRRNLDSFFSSFKYSGGLSYDTGYLTIQENDISTLWINTGLGLLSRSSSSIDISFRYGFRGTTNNNLIKERIWELGFSVNLTELMFIRPKLR